MQNDSIFPPFSLPRFSLPWHPSNSALSYFLSLFFYEKVMKINNTNKNKIKWTEKQTEERKEYNKHIYSHTWTNNFPSPTKTYNLKIGKHNIQAKYQLMGKKPKEKIWKKIQKFFWVYIELAIYCWVWDLPFNVVCILNDTPLEKSIFLLQLVVSCR